MKVFLPNAKQWTMQAESGKRKVFDVLGKEVMHVHHLVMQQHDATN